MQSKKEKQMEDVRMKKENQVVILELDKCLGMKGDFKTGLIYLSQVWNFNFFKMASLNVKLYHYF